LREQQALIEAAIFHPASISPHAESRHGV
jgi:hypothetical protein